MALVSFIEKQSLYRLLDISEGYIFHYWSQQGRYNKNITHDILLDACNIDIYKDPDYSSLSQQKCFDKILASNNPVLISKMINGFCEYFKFTMGEYPQWNQEDYEDFAVAGKIIERLNSQETVTLPEIEKVQSIEILTQDIEHNLHNGTPELVLDRLHTFSTIYLREKCKKHNLPTADDKGNSYSLDGLAGKLKNYYIEHDCCKSEFSVQAVKTMISLFAKYNDIRNDHSFAHENDILAKDEAEYAVKTMLATLQFIEKLESTIEDLPF